MKNNSWRKAGWRSLLHRGYPKAVVRFGTSGGLKLKLLCNEQEFLQSEIAAGRMPEQTLAIMLKQAEAAWRDLEK